MSFSLSRLFGGGGNGAQAKQQQQQELLRQIGIQQGTGAINSLFDKQFTDDFFNGRRQAALNYYMPQLDQQYSDAQKQLTYALARAGGSQSSAAAQQQGDLQQKYSTNRQQIADQANNLATGARNNVESARANLIAMLNTTGDTQGALNSARASMASLSAPDAYSPLADLFTTATSALNQQGALEQANIASMGAVQPRYWSGLFGKRQGRNAAVVNS
ncbi:hypothetical protein [Methylocystis parvus]|uniref:hypothetical protein n=1 Tax=Methylocystis parvus TaxID=134 RepID=UPI003C732171